MTREVMYVSMIKISINLSACFKIHNGLVVNFIECYQSSKKS